MIAQRQGDTWQPLNICQALPIQLKTAGRQRRANRHGQALGRCAAFTELLHGAVQHPGQRALQAGMHGGHLSLLPVGKQYG